MDGKKLEKVIKDNCVLKTVPVKLAINTGSRKNIVHRRTWEITDINLGPIIEEAEKQLRPKIEKEIKKEVKKEVKKQTEVK